MAQKKARHAGGQMCGKTGFLAKAVRATEGQTLPHIAPSRSCIFPEHAGISLLPLNFWKLHPHPESQQCPVFALQKALENRFQVLHCSPCKSQKCKRPLKVSKFSCNLFLLCVWLYCDLLFYGYILNFSKSPSIMGSAIFWHYPVQNSS